MTVTFSATNDETRPAQTGLASVPAVKQYLRAAEAHGIDAAPLLIQVGIDPLVLQNNRQHVSSAAMEQLIELLVKASADPCLGLHAAHYVEPASYSVLGYISMNCSTLREVLAKIPVYEKIVGDMGVSSTECQGDCVLQRWQCQFSNPIARRHEVETVIGSWYAYTRRFLDMDASFARAVWFEHPAPDKPELLDSYHAHFDCELAFSQAASGILIPSSKLDEPLPQANEALLQTLLEHATELLAELDRNQSVTHQVKNLLRLILKEHPPSTTLIAENLGLSERTLQRKLTEEGTSYKTVLNELRLELALHYLENTSLSLDTIAAKLGYAEPRSFYRGFKQWTGRTAGSFREAAAD